MKASHGNLPISVVIPAYQAQLFLDEAIAGIYRQTVKVGEIVVIDDGSTDGTRDVARSHGVRLIVRQNGGPAAARNAGVRAALFPWIAFLDADDYWRSDKLELQWAAYERNPEIGLIATDYELVREVGETSRSGLALHKSYKSIKRIELENRAVLVDRTEIGKCLPLGQFLLPSTLLIERKLLIEHPFDETIRSGEIFTFPEDFEWLLRVARDTDAIVIEAPLAEYRQRSTSLTRSWGRLRYGDVKLCDLVVANPERYVSGAPEAFRDARIELLERAALQFLRQSDFDGARRMMGELRIKPRTRTLIIYSIIAQAARFLPFTVILQLLRVAWRFAKRYSSRGVDTSAAANQGLAIAPCRRCSYMFFTPRTGQKKRAASFVWLAIFSRL